MPVTADAIVKFTLTEVFEEQRVYLHFQDLKCVALFYD
jgi:hypothetical protein